jgi:hypothetical protein
MDCRDLSDSNVARQGRQVTRARLVRLIFFLLFLVYPVTSKKILAFFVCREVNGTSYLLSDFSLICGDSLWLSYLPYALGFTLLYPIGLPLLFFIVLRKYHKQRADPLVRSSIGFLMDSYVDKSWYFELVSALLFTSPRPHVFLILFILSFASFRSTC